MPPHHIIVGGFIRLAAVGHLSGCSAKPFLRSAQQASSAISIKPLAMALYDMSDAGVDKGGASQYLMHTCTGASLTTCEMHDVDGSNVEDTSAFLSDRCDTWGNPHSWQPPNLPAVPSTKGTWTVKDGKASAFLNGWGNPAYQLETPPPHCIYDNSLEWAITAQQWATVALKQPDRAPIKVSTFPAITNVPVATIQVQEDGSAAQQIQVALGMGHAMLDLACGECALVKWQTRYAVIFAVDVRSWSYEFTGATSLYLDPWNTGGFNAWSATSNISSCMIPEVSAIDCQSVLDQLN